MNEQQPSEEMLRQAYQRLQHTRNTTAVPDVSLETIKALAEGSYVGRDQAMLLELVLSHPETAREFKTFAQVARLAPQRASAFSQPVMAFAAMVVVAIGIGAYFAARERPDTLRSATSALGVVSPERDAQWTDSTIFAWHSMKGASSYRVDILDEDGGVSATIVTPDTTARITRVQSAAKELRWVVTAIMTDGSAPRSEPRALKP